MVVSNVRDITYLKALEEELAKARELNETFSGEIAHFRHVDSSEATIVYHSETMKEIVRLIYQVAAYPTTVLISGESGVGKEVIASLIHHHSPRAKQPFIKINCSAIPENLLESELFGYERGAFSGALKNGKLGLFELADGGTILLDEIGDLPLNLQAKLLRVLQEREVRKIGGTKTIPIDIRIISATNRQLKDLVDKGEFREDLFYRLNVINLHIPPLRDRKEDIPPLFAYYLKKFCKAYGIQKSITPETMEYLQSYHWPGNIREIRNLMENLIVSTVSNEITPAHLPSYMKQTLAARSPNEPVPAVPHEKARRNAGLKEVLRQTEQELIREALQRHRSVRQAAAALQIDHSTLLRKMKKLTREPFRL
ncbi:sigma-54 interaction domain-containing protein [Brevibacillus massiliensis]|uniref:sigma-54 interaction domain-containing protein n=1 Tax=Brevibacillus massiliensis TaxID=1118054 RepID=UPI000319F4DA|nr:sigma 54-interacting transcriptional regulator [Brevibacillus massiliensis]